jgi:adenosine kinase
MALQTACLEAKKPLALNLASPFLVSAFSSRVIDAIHASTFVFGNHEEFLALATASKEPRMLAAAAAGDLASIVQWVRSLSALPGACEESGRTVVCTRGCEPTIHLEGPRDAPVIEHFDVTRIPVDEICDTNGAGDAFVAGYLAELIDGAPVAKRVQTAHAIAGRVVRHEGAVM